MTGDEQDERLKLEVSTTEALRIAPDTGGNGVPIWWVVAGAVVLLVAIVGVTRVGGSSAPSPPTTATPTPDGVAVVDTASPSSSSTPVVADIEVGDVVNTDVVRPVLGLDVALLDDADRLWVLHTGDGTATYRGEVEMNRILPVGAAAPPWTPSLNVSRGGWLLVGGTFGTVTVNPEGQHILTAHDGAEPVTWDGRDSVTYTYSPETGAAHVVYDGGAEWLSAPIRVGPMDRRVVVPTDDGTFLIDDDDVSLLSPEQVLAANQRFFIARSGGGELTVVDLESGAPVGTVSPSFLTNSDAAQLMADPELEASVAPDGRTVSLLDAGSVYLVDVASGSGGQTALTQWRGPNSPAAAAWDPVGDVATWVVGGEIEIVELDRAAATIGPSINTDGPIPIGIPIAAVAYEPTN